MNMASLVAQRNLGNAQAGLTTSVERLSSGLRINRSKDDAAGLAISEVLTAQVRSIRVAARNANDAISTVQVAEGALQEVSSMLQRMKELSTQGNNGALGPVEKGFLIDEIKQLRDEINGVSLRTTFNGNSLIGADSHSLSFQVGASAGDAITIGAFSDISIDDGATYSMAVDKTDGHDNASKNLSKPAEAISVFSALATAITDAATKDGVAPFDLQANNDLVDSFAKLSIALDSAINEVSSRRASFGAMQSRLDHNITNLQTQAENMDAARSRIQDTDYAAETANLTRGQILQQAATAMLSQANQMPNVILSLLK
jgi:flagellin